ncbi:TOTE conflict system archaeo-eukaryotic primase domain-containing protein [Solobacterium moorei]|nr:DEAD/DEAH box helicase family protein [Solobacterium moorei]
MDETRVEELIKLISELKKENEFLKRILKDNKIKFKTELIEEEYDNNQGARILPILITKNLASQFFARFWGRMDVYSQRVVNKAGEIGYYPQCKNFWLPRCRRRPEFNYEGKRKGTTCLDCMLQNWKEITPQTIINHLMGKITIGIYPLLSDDTCRFLVFDFDNHTKKSEQTDFSNEDEKWKEEVSALREICKINHIDALVERSRSGNGAHVWIFFEQPITAEKARKFGNALLDKGAESVNLQNFRYYDRMIPAQDYLKNGGLGNLIALPLQPEALKNGNSAFVDDNWNAYPNQYEVLFSKHRLTAQEIEQMMTEWSGINPFENRMNVKNARNKPWENQLELCKEDVHGIFRIVVSNQLFIDTLNLSPRIQNQIRKMAAFRNPIFYKNQAMNISNFANSRFIYLGEDIDGYIVIPRGILSSLVDRLKEAAIPYEIEDKRQNGHKIHVDFQGTLRDNQRSAVEHLIKYDNGILSAATAFGKTVVCCNLIACKKVNTLILLESSSLIDQWVKAVENFLLINEELPTYKTKTGILKVRKSNIGILHGAKDTTTGIIDIAMVGTLYGKGKFHSRLQDYGMVIIDECHHAASDTIQRILQEVKAKYVYGVTATPIREDGLDKINYILIGPIRFRYSSRERAEEQGIEHLVYPRFTRVVSPRTKKLDINEAYELIRDDYSRNNLIVEDTRKCLDRGRCPVILTKYTEHARLLHAELDGYADHTILLLGSTPSKEKKVIVQELHNIPKEESILLIATGQLIGEGFDYPRLDTLIMASPIAGRTVVEQYAGRLNRDYESKKDVIIYDYIDIHIPVFDRMYSKRLRAYKKIGYHLFQEFKPDLSNSHGFIYDIDNYFETFKIDLVNAKKEVIICSPSIRASKVNQLIGIMKSVQERGVRITIITRHMDYDKYNDGSIHAALSEKLINHGFDVLCFETVSEHFAVIDKSIVWYGSMNFLGREDVEDNLMRIVDVELASELLEIACEGK